LLGDFEKGCEVLEKMLAVPGRTKLYFPLAYLIADPTYCETMGETSGRSKKSTKASGAFQTMPGLVFTKAQVLRKMDRWDDAQECWSRSDAARTHGVLRHDRTKKSSSGKVYTSWRAFTSTKKSSTKRSSTSTWHSRNKPNSVALQSTKAGYLEHLGRYYDAELAYRVSSRPTPPGVAPNW